MKKLLLLFPMLAWFCAATADTAQQWVLITDSGIEVAISDVECLVAADNAESFTVMKKTPTDNITGVKSATFTKRELSSIGSTLGGNGMTIMPDHVSNSITITGAPGAEARITATNGRTVLQTRLTEYNDRIDISSLEPGMYILSINNSSIKFIKK